MTRQIGCAAFVAGLAITTLTTVSGCSTTTDARTGSTTTTTPSAAATVAPRSTAAASAPPATVSENNPCAAAPYTAAQFAGDWGEDGGSGYVTTLGVDGEFVIRRGEHVSETGSWSYSPWEFTSAADLMPASAAGTCVLWLHIPAPSTDRVYVPLSVAPDSLELSYVGRGNTLIWKRSRTTS